MKKYLKWLQAIVWISVAQVSAFGLQPVARLLLVPPSPVTDKIMLDIRGAVENTSDRSAVFHLALYLDACRPRAWCTLTCSASTATPAPEFSIDARQRDGPVHTA